VSEGADHIVGPLRREAVSAVFAQKSLPVPVLALNQPDHNEPAPAGSAAFGLSPDAEAAQVAQHMIDRGFTRASIIVSSSDWGERAAAAFRTQFEGQHGSIVGEARVRDGDVNLSTSIRQATAGLPVADDSGIFIAMLPQQARLLLPQLKLVNQAAHVFATSHIFSGVLNAGLDNDLNGVEFCDAPWLFDAVVGLPRRSDIAASLESARGAGARLFAMGLDAYALVPYLDWLGQHHDSYVPGATGQLTTDASGRVLRILTWARFDDGVAQPLNGGLQMSTLPAH
jgi:outer membrane PBP1 activator LpoA protein